MPSTAKILKIASTRLIALQKHNFDVLTIKKPVSPRAAVNLAKIVSKLSPLVGNLIEINIVELLNQIEEFRGYGEWIRQDPGFPDAIFSGKIRPVPGFEVKAWFPFATEITARFRDSQTHFRQENTFVALLAWVPNQLIFGTPEILAVCVAPGSTIAKSRDDHYHNPPDYIVLEPEDTTTRTRNLQQTNTAGYKFQGTPKQLAQAQKLVAGWGKEGRLYKPTPEYQAMLRELVKRFSYRLDTNYAKIDRIVHPVIEAFKTRVYDTVLAGSTVRQWGRLLKSGNDAQLASALAKHFQIREEAAVPLVQ